MNGLLKPRKCGQTKEGRDGERERERDLHAIYINYRTEKKAGRFEREKEREREREREERGKGAFAVGDRFCRYHFFTNQNNRPYYVCRQPNAAKVVVVVVVVVVGPS